MGVPADFTKDFTGDFWRKSGVISDVMYDTYDIYDIMILYILYI